MLPPGKTLILLSEGGKRMPTKSLCGCQVLHQSVTLALKHSLLTPAFGTPDGFKGEQHPYFLWSTAIQPSEIIFSLFQAFVGNAQPMSCQIPAHWLKSAHRKAY